LTKKKDKVVPVRRHIEKWYNSSYS